MRLLLLDLYSALFVPRFRYSDSYSQMRARVTLMLAVFIAAISMLLLVALALIPERGDFVNNNLTIGLAVLLVQILVIGLVHAGQLRAATAIMLSLLVLIGLATIFLTGVGSNTLLVAVLPLLFTAFILPWNTVMLTAVVEIGALLITGVLQSQGVTLSGISRIDPALVMPHMIIDIVLLLVLGVIGAVVSHELGRVLRFAGRLTTQLRATGEIAQLTATAAGPDALMQRIVNYVRDRFGFYYVQVFLIDAEGKYANLAAGTGEVGEMLLQRGYRLAVGSQSMVGRAFQTGEPVVASREFALEAPRTNELLRDTRSELALPLIVGDQVIGVLDVQSNRPGAFADDIVENLRILAAQIGVAVHHTRQIEERTAALNDMRRQFLETEVSLREAHRLNQRLTGKAWEDYLKARSSQIVGYTLADNRLQRDSSWTPALAQAAGNRRAVIAAMDEARQVIAVPIELRGRAIGAIEIEIEGEIRQAETLEVLQSVAQRLALSIDNARLFEQAQELAQRELEVNAISTQLQSVSDVNDLARTALQELSKSLGASQASIRLGMLEADRDSRPKRPEGLLEHLKASRQTDSQPAIPPGGNTQPGNANINGRSDEV